MYHPRSPGCDEELKSSWSLLGGVLIRSILTGASYPERLYIAIIDRFHHDSDESGRSRKNQLRVRRLHQSSSSPTEAAQQML